MGANSIGSKLFLMSLILQRNACIRLVLTTKNEGYLGVKDYQIYVILTGELVN